MKRFFLVGMSMVLLAAANKAAAQGAVLTLKQCIETGIANNLVVQQNKLQSEVAAIDLKQAKLNRLPDLNGSINHGINQGRSIDPFTNSFINQQVNYAGFGLNSGVLLFNGLRLQNTVKQNSLTYEAVKMEQQQAQDNLTINIILAYLQVLTSEDILSQSKIQAELTKKQVERLDIMNKEGAIAPPLLYDLKGQYAGDQLSIISNENSLQLAKLALSQLMNIPFDKNMQLEKLQPASFAAKYDDSPAAVRDIALKQFAQVVAADLRRKSAEAAVKVASATLYPSLSFNANANTNYSSAASQEKFINTTDVTSTDYVIVSGNQTSVIKKQNNFQSSRIAYASQLNNNLFNSFSVNLSIPIFNGSQARNRVKLAKINVRNNALAVQTVKNELGQAIDQAFINLETASERYKVLTGQEKAFTESFRAAEIRFASGVGTSVDYLIAKNNIDRVNLNLITAKYDYVLRTKLLDYYQGKKLW